MATYTASNAIKKIATGDESGTWGDSTNNNADIIDRASNGFVAIALTGTSYTLPLSTTAVLSLGHYKAIRFYGTPGGTCTVTLEQDNKPRMYMIYNNTDESVIINQGSGSGTKVTIPTGDSAIVLADGTGTNANVIDFTGQITGLSLLTGITAGTVAASKAVVVDANKDITGFRNVTSTGTVTAATLAIGAASLVEAELEMLDGVTAGTVAASKVAVVDANKDITGFRNVTSTGTVTAATLAIGSASLVEAELEMLDGVTAGTVAASKAVVVNADKDISSFRNLTATGAVTAGSLVIGSADISEAELETIDGITAGTVAASKALVVDSNKKLNELNIDNITVDGNTISTTDSNGNLLLTPNGSGDIIAETDRFIMRNTSDGVAGPTLILEHATATPSDVDFNGIIAVSTTDAGGNAINPFELYVTTPDDASGAAKGRATFKIKEDGAIPTYLTLDGVDEKIILGKSTDVTGGITATGAVTAGSLVIGSADISEAELETIDGVTAGTVAASKALVVDANKKLNELLVDNITIDGDIVSTSANNGLALSSGDDLEFVVPASNARIYFKRATATAIDWSLAGSSSSLRFINDQSGGVFASIDATHLTSSASALEIRSEGAGLTLNSGGGTIPLEHDGTQRGYLNLDTADTIKIYTGTGTGTLSTTISGDDLTVVGTVTAGTFTTGLSTFNLLASFNSSHGISCSAYRPPSGVNEVVNFLSSGGDQRLSFQMSALPIQTISQNGTTLKLKTTALSSARELSYPDATGTLATTDQTIGFGQTWQALTNSRSASTGQSSNVYQAPIRTITVSLTGPSTLALNIYIGTNANMSNEVLVASGAVSTSALVPPNHYYRVTMSGSSVYQWAELR